jgi:hypothetical protein
VKLAWELKLMKESSGHINIKKVPSSGTLSDANKRRASPVFQAIFNYLNNKYQGAILDSILPNAHIDSIQCCG